MARIRIKSGMAPVLALAAAAVLVGCQDEQPMRRISTDGSSTSAGTSSSSVQIGRAYVREKVFQA
ncbi:hypothetical protein I3U64_17675, partial [Mycobacteroides abscessus subsp. abscessus]|nr:hypothetical protein [Mycobacteroides abscessus subsp. abscessus]